MYIEAVNFFLCWYTVNIFIILYTNLFLVDEKDKRRSRRSFKKQRSPAKSAAKSSDTGKYVFQAFGRGNDSNKNFQIFLLSLNIYYHLFNVKGSWAEKSMSAKKYRTVLVKFSRYISYDTQMCNCIHSIVFQRCELQRLLSLLLLLLVALPLHMEWFFFSLQPGHMRRGR